MPPEVQTAGVVVENVTGSPDVAVALTVKEPLPTIRSGSGPNVMVWLTFVDIAGSCAIRPTAVLARSNVMPPMIVLNWPFTVT